MRKDGRQARPANDVGRSNWCPERPTVDGWRKAWEDFWSSDFWSSAETRREYQSHDETKTAFIAGWIYATVAFEVYEQASERVRRREASHGPTAQDASQVE